MDIENRVKVAIAKQLGVKLETVTPEALLSDDLGADSIDAIELIMVLEEEFGLIIPDEIAEKVTKVSDILCYIVARKTTSGVNRLCNS